MSTPQDAELDELRARLRALESDNARLADAARVAESSRPADTARPGTPQPSAGRWRAALSALCIVLAAVLVPVSIVTAWARVQLVDEDAFVATLAPLVDDPAVQNLIIDQAERAIDAQIDIAAVTADVFDGIVELGLGPRAEAALRLLEQPAASGVQSLVSQTVAAVVRSEAFADVWASTLRAAHRALTTASTSDGGGIVVLSGDGLGIQLGPIVAQVKQTLTDSGFGIASIIPAVDRVVIVGSGDNLRFLRAAYTIAAAVGWVLPIAVLVLFGAGIALARRRGVAVLGTGIGLAVGGAVLGSAFSVGGTAVGLAAGDLDPGALQVIYQALVSTMTQTAWVIAVLGVFLGVLGWLMGRSRAARGVRSAVDGLNDSARAALAARGLDTGSFGVWLARHRVAVRSLLVIGAVLWLFALRPLAFADVVLVVLVTLAIGWVLELLQRRETAPVIVDVAVVAEGPVSVSPR